MKINKDIALDELIKLREEIKTRIVELTKLKLNTNDDRLMFRYSLRLAAEQAHLKVVDGEIENIKDHDKKFGEIKLIMNKDKEDITVEDIGTIVNTLLGEIFND